jgi:hypothetical protein
MTYKLRSKITSVFLENAENYRFLAFFSPEIYHLLGYILESTQIPANTFFKFRPQTQNINFFRSRKKISEKKYASFLSIVVSKESHENTDQKVG